MIEEPSSLLRSISYWLGIVLLIAIVLEITFFPSLANALGCIMALTSYGVFRYFLKRHYIVNFPFAFLMYLSMFLYRYLPLVATILEGKPITYGFERPIVTFFYEILLFLISSLAFYLACGRLGKKSSNNLLTKSLYQCGFFKISKSELWILGFMGLVIRIFTFSLGSIEYGDVTGKFVSGLGYLYNAPIILLFPKLINLKDNYSKKPIWLYISVIFLINIASNSRESIIAPVATALILFFLNAIISNVKLSDIISIPKVAGVTILIFFGISIISDLSLAMLYTRAVRGDVGKMQLLTQTIDTYRDKELLNSLRNKMDRKTKVLESYSSGWTEDYLDNFMLNRYANMRISDQTLYYAERIGFGNTKMRNSFYDRWLSLLPSPVLKALKINLDKAQLSFSRGDLLFGSNLSSFKVTSHIADGLATFGYLYFLIQLLAFLIVFKLLNYFVYTSIDQNIYAPYALMSVFVFLGMFRNANGISSDISFIFRGFWQGIITYLIFVTLSRAVSAIMLRKRS